ncbi:MAG TPA: aspartyl protease family protein [Terriglobia bacterium]|nr:aspartyl protease family protein [Terriglobia bacterium]
MSRNRLSLFAVLAAAMAVIPLIPGPASPASAFQPGVQGPIATNVADLLLFDDYLRAEALLDQRPTGLTPPELLAFRGEVEFRKGHFNAAEELYRRALAADSKTARAYDGLGKLAMAKLRIDDAIESFGRAASLDAREPLYRLHASDAYGANGRLDEQRKYIEEYIRLKPKDADRLAEVQAGLATIDALTPFGPIGKIEAPERPLPIPFRKTLNLIFSDVFINNQGPFRFAIDSGATLTAVNPQVISALGLKPLTTTVMHGIGGNGKAESSMFRADTLQIGGIRIRNVPLGTYNDPVVSQIADGIIGTSALAEFIVTINYPENRVDLTRNVPGPGAPETDTIPAWFFSNLLLVPAEINGHPGNFLVDTGAVASVLSHSMAAQLGVTRDTPGARAAQALGGVGGADGSVLTAPNVTIKVSKTTRRFDAMLAIDLKDFSRMIGTEISGIMGFDLLDGRAVTLDYSAPEVRLISAPENIR